MTKTCSVVEDSQTCGRTHEAHGMCNKHYKRWQAHGDPLIVAKPQRCGVVDNNVPCRRDHFGHGYCSLHYQRWRTHGNPLGAPKVERTCPVVEHGATCGRPPYGHGMCGMHWKRWHKYGDPLGAAERISPVARFWLKVDKDGPVQPILGTRCWIWAGTLDGKGYGTFSLDGKNVRAHRFSYGLASRLDSAVEIDHHYACPKTCVNPQHLRPATRKQNMENLAGARRDSKSGVRGVVWIEARQKWCAAIQHNKKSIYLGLFTTIAEAEAAVIAKRNELFTHNDADRAVA